MPLVRFRLEGGWLGSISTIVGDVLDAARSIFGPTGLERAIAQDQRAILIERRELGTPNDNMPFNLGNFISGAVQTISNVANIATSVRNDIATIAGNPPPVVLAPATVPTPATSGPQMIPGPNDRIDPFPFGANLSATPVGIPALGGAIAGAIVPSLLPSFGNELPGLQLPDPFNQGVPTTVVGRQPTKAQIRKFLLDTAGVNWQGFLCVIRAFGPIEGGNRLGLEGSAVAFLLGNKPKRRARGITGSQLKTTRATLRRLNSVNATVKEACRGFAAPRRRAARKPC